MARQAPIDISEINSHCPPAKGRSQFRVYTLWQAEVYGKQLDEKAIELSRSDSAQLLG